MYRPMLVAISQSDAAGPAHLKRWKSLRCLPDWYFRSIDLQPPMKKTARRRRCRVRPEFVAMRNSAQRAARQSVMNSNDSNTSTLRKFVIVKPSAP